jgi:outer membrane protein
LSHTEIGLYYEVWDTGFDLDLGLNVKFFDGNVSITDGTDTATSTFNETIPMLYASVGIPLIAGFTIGGDLNYVSYDGDTFQDYIVNVRWVSDFLLGIELGYRSFTIDYTDGNKFADVKITGPYANLRLEF